jgi:hypothetical protein
MKMDSKKLSPTLFIKLLRNILVLSAILLLNIAATGTALAGPVFTAGLSGLQEAPSNASTATGFATFTFNDALTELSYELSVFGLIDVTAAHIHLAPVGSNGPIVLWLYPFGLPAQLIPGESNGLLSQRTVTSADLVNVLAGQSLSALLTEMIAGNAYVNVHTAAIPAGEIRGQIHLVSAPATVPVIIAGLLMLATVRRRRLLLEVSSLDN